ncbi:hypothetical protein F0562_029728 [Nyssa sinensis]|uniref:BHLH domain-containing protein n=1 Tax=Nyssa sinensis TaxID=561372 RepID=A0A5J5AX09_9ASTE|nr:hypothetical protein F0562_029728 [Nyssa sinensis]
MEMRNWFPDDFFRQVPVRELLPLPTDHDQKRPSSSSSSLRSLSMDSPECSTLLFNIPSTSYIPEPPIEQALRQISTPTSPLQQAIQALSQIRNLQFPIESENAAMTRAILAVISSPSSSSSSHHPQQNIPLKYQATRQRASAFRSYRSALSPSTQINSRVIRRENMLKRAMTFFKRLSLTRTQEQLHGSRHTSTQLHHMISERRRREKLNESFQALRSLLPPGSKKDKASVLNSTMEYVSSLKGEVSELARRNQLLEAQLVLPASKEAAEEEESRRDCSSNERIDIRLTHIAESTSEARIIDLKVILRGECSLLDIAIRLMEFFKQDENLSLMSVEAETHMEATSSINRVMLRLKIEGGEWDESAFQEAVRRVVADLAQ